jgi:hypothetical protein
MDSGFETALNTCIENAEHASKAVDAKVKGGKKAEEKKVD